MYAGPTTMALVAILFVLGLYVVHRLMAVAPDPLVVLPFQSVSYPRFHGVLGYLAPAGSRMVPDGSG
jgi:hypothetical protein